MRRAAAVRADKPPAMSAPRCLGHVVASELVEDRQRPRPVMVMMNGGPSENSTARMVRMSPVCWGNAVATEVEILLESADLVRPDIVGWRRDRCPERPVGFPIKTSPDWICEIVSPGNANHDTIKQTAMSRVCVLNAPMSCARNRSMRSRSRLASYSGTTQQSSESSSSLSRFPVRSR